MHSNFAEETSLRLQIKELADVQSRNREQLKLNRSLSSRERMEARLEAIKQKECQLLESAIASNELMISDLE
jgi:hypothetical protein